MDILFLVHIEHGMLPCMQVGYPERVAEIVDAATYSRVYHMSSWIGSDAHLDAIAGVVTATIDWGWGYEPDKFEDEPEELPWLIESSGHEYTWVPPELRDLARLLRSPGVCVTVGGGHEYECMEDFLCVLDHLEIEYQVDHDLVYHEYPNRSHVPGTPSRSDGRWVPPGM